MRLMMNKMVILIFLIMIVTISGCSAEIGHQRPDIEGKVSVVDTNNMQLTIVVSSIEKGIETFELVIKNNTQIANYKTNEEIDFEQLNTGDEVQVWFGSQIAEEKYYARLLKAVPLTQESFVSEMTPEDSTKYNIYIFYPGDIRQQEEKVVVNNKKYGLFIEGIVWSRGNNTVYQRFLDISDEDKTYFVLNHDGIVIQTNDIHELISFFQDLTKGIKLEHTFRVYKGEGVDWNAVLDESTTEIWRNDDTDNETYENTINERMVIEYKGGLQDISKAEYHYKNSVRESSGIMELELEQKNFRNIVSADHFYHNRPITPAADQFILTIKWQGQEEVLVLQLFNEETESL